jgi:WD40 repeat protein
VWDAADGRELRRMKAADSGYVHVAISPDGKQIAAASLAQSLVQVWDAATGAELFTLKGYANPIQGVAFSPDSRRIATPAAAIEGDGVLKLWDAATGQELLTLKGGVEVWARPVGFSADGTRFFALNCAVSRFENRLQIWDARPIPGAPAPPGHAEKPEDRQTVRPLK